MAKKSKVVFAFVIVTIFVGLAGCANQLAPQGGDVDKVPPMIIEVTPLNGTVNFAGDHFEITFDKYVEKRSVQDAIFISPTIQKGFKYDWSGKTLDVYFKDSLKKNATYTVTIGTDVKDLNNSNKMAEAFTFAFSTGPKIDKGTLSGRIYDPAAEGAMVLSYKADTIQPDISKQKPDYVSQVGKNGKYTLLGLSDGKYEVFAIRDQLRDLLYSKNDDEIGIQFENLVLKDSMNKISDVDFFLTKKDTIAPAVTNVFMKDRYHMAVEFGKPVDSTKISAKNFYVEDTVSQTKIFPRYFFKGDAKANQFYLVIEDSLNPGNSWELFSDSIPDLQNNFSVLEKTSFIPQSEPDTVALKPLSVQGELPDGKVDLDDRVVVLKFNDAVDSTIIGSKISVEDQKGNTIPRRLSRVDDASFNIKLLAALKQSAEYILKVDLKNFKDLAGNVVDSLFQFKFTTANELDFSGASGTVNGMDSTSTIVVLQSATGKQVSYSQKLSSKHNFDFKKIVPDKYVIWSFLDRNKNNKYDFGSVQPFQYSEEFKYYPDTLNLRARWPVGDISISFDRK